MENITAKEVLGHSTPWLIAFVKKNRDAYKFLDWHDRELLLLASDEIKHRNKRAFAANLARRSNANN